MPLHGIAHGGCTDTSRELTLGEKSPAVPGTQTYISAASGFSLAFSPTLCQLNYSPNLDAFCGSSYNYKMLSAGKMLCQ